MVNKNKINKKKKRFYVILLYVNKLIFYYTKKKPLIIIIKGSKCKLKKRENTNSGKLMEMYNMYA